MGKSAADKARGRFRQAFEEGQEPPPPRTEVNRVLLEEVRAEFRAEMGTANAPDKGVKRKALAPPEACPGPEEEPEAAPESESDPEDEPDSAPSDPEDLAAYRQRKLNRAQAMVALDEQRKADQALRAAERSAKLQNMPFHLCQVVPAWFRANVERFYRQDPSFREELSREMDLVESDSMAVIVQLRNNCRQCRRKGHRKNRYYRDDGCDEHPHPDIAGQLRALEAKKRDEYAGVAVEAAIAMKRAADERDRAEEAARQAAEQRVAKAVQLLGPDCRRCGDCYHMDYGVHGTGASSMCEEHAREFDEVVEKLERGQR